MSAGTTPTGAAPRIRAIRSAVPPTVLVQSQVRDVFASQPGIGRLAARLVGASFDASGIDTRQSVIEDFDLTKAQDSPRFYDQESGTLLAPGTGARNDLYTEAGRLLFVSAAEAALGACPDLTPGDVTHVVTVSCTGFYAPGPDYDIVRSLGLAPTTLRYHIGFMGCYAAFPALRAAADFCRADPSAVVLVVSAELCTLHVRSSNEPDQIVASSVFGDGAAAAVVTARPGGSGPALRLDRFGSTLTPEGQQDMAWTIGDAGFEMVLSSYVPKIIGEYIEGAVAPLIEGLPAAEGARTGEVIRHWAVHPGGRSILDKVEDALELSPEQMTPSREVLREHGNMSSATVLFILERILDGNDATEEGPTAESPTGDGTARKGADTATKGTAAEDAAAEESVCAMAFGPGLTVETALLTRMAGG